MNPILIMLAALSAQTATPTTAATPELRERVLVYGLRADGVDARIVQSIERGIVATAVEVGYEAISSQDIATILDLEATRQAAGCDGESSCVAELAGGLGARLVVTGTVVRIDGNRYELSLTLLEPNATTVKNRASVDAISASALRDVTKDTTLRLLGVAAPVVAVVDNSGMTALWIGGLAAAGVGIAGVVYGVLPLTNALTNAGYAQDAADAWQVSGNDDDLQKLTTANARYTEHVDNWNTWGWPVVAAGGVFVVGGAVAVVVGLAGQE